MPRPAELVKHYARRTDRDLSTVDWYTALAGFKLGIVLEGTYARACAGQADPAVGARLHRSTVELLTRAAEIAGT